MAISTVVASVVALTLSVLSLLLFEHLWFVAFPFLVIGLASLAMTLRQGESAGVKVASITVNLMALLTFLIAVPVAHNL